MTRELKHLIKRIEGWSGMDENFEGEGEVPTHKIKGGYEWLEPGVKLRVVWNDEEYGFADEGYLTVFPFSGEGNDIWMAGVVHIPNPVDSGGKGGGIEPVWLSLNDLLLNEYVASVEPVEAQL